ncbi:preprotein translocase subunit YajC [candidate division KSB1 bacterium]|nr:preprotein translocase subunit YajC [candidate division KSB1 bacterium]RQW01627.1 MAG: preprotein translocase subunit YajC [candidate division KSB1 bacterium]
MGPSGTSGQGGNPLTMFMPLILIFLIMWLLIFRPQARKQKQHQMMVQQVQSGDRVLTVGGFYGVVRGFKNDKVVILEIDKNVKIELLKSSIAQNLTAEERMPTGKSR